MNKAVSILETSQKVVVIRKGKLKTYLGVIKPTVMTFKNDYEANLYLWNQAYISFSEALEPSGFTNQSDYLDHCYAKMTKSDFDKLENLNNFYHKVIK